MSNMGVIFALLVIVFAVGAAVMMSNTDTSSPALAAEEMRQGGPGAAAGTIFINQIGSVLLGILVTGAVGGIGGAVLMTVRDWLQDRMIKPDWEPGPNANWRRRGGGGRSPAMSRDELLQLALLNVMTQGQAGRYMPQVRTDEPDDGGVEGW